MLIRGMGYMSAGIYNPYGPPPGAPPSAPPVGAPPAAPDVVVPPVIIGMPPPPVAIPPAPVSVALGPSLASTGPAVPIGAASLAVLGPDGQRIKGPNETELDNAMAAAGVTTNDQAAAFLSALDGNPAPQFLDETSSAYYLGLLKQQTEATFLKWGIGGAVVLAAGIFLLK